MTVAIEAIERMLEEAAVPNARALAALALPSHRLTARRCPLDSLRVGESRLGGTPDVPPGFSWPMHRDRPLTFLAQISLAELKASELPHTGSLLFFYDVAEQPMGFDPLHRGGARVFYFDVPDEALVRFEHPDVRSAGGPFEPCGVTFDTTQDLPAYFDDLLKEGQRVLLNQHTTPYQTAADAIRGVATGEPYHHLFGHPQYLQGNMRIECQLVTSGIYCGVPNNYESTKADELIAQAKQWTLLLQLDNDEAGPDWLWGDNGRIYFWIRREDLQARDFNKVWLIRQCE